MSASCEKTSPCRALPNCRTGNGFSLVELAIALTVIGLLMAGLVKGSELIDNARNNRVVVDFNNIQTSMMNFKRTYNALPGDMRDASDRINDCDAAPCDGDGNNDFRIHTAPALNSNPFGHENYPAASEMRAFWVQMAKVGMIDGIDATYTGRPNRAGVDYIETPYGGGYRVFNTEVWAGTNATTFPHIRDNVIRPSLVLGNVAGAGTAQMVFTAKQAASIDRKMDDGNPMTGRILGLASGSGACTASGNNRLYPEAQRNARCNLLYVLGY